MKRFAFIIFTLSLLVAPVLTLDSARAQTNPVAPACDEATTQSPLCVLHDPNENPITGTIALVVNILSWVVGVASIIMIILAGLKYVTSNGDPNAISSAKNTVLYALVGVGVFALSQAIVLFVINKL